MPPFCRLVLTFALFAVGRANADAADRELVFGIYPYLSPSQIVAQFQPLRRHLEQDSQQPVVLRSAPDFQAFVERTGDGEYDLIFTAPHMGRLAQRRDGYLPLAQTGYRIKVVAVTRRDRAIRSLADLDGRSLAIGARLSMTYQIVDRALSEYGLALDRQVRFVNTASFSNVLEAVLRDEADAGATGTLLWDAAVPEQRAQLREIHRSEAVPGFLVLAHPRLDAGTLRRLRQSLFDFRFSDAGRRYFQRSRQIDFRPVDEQTLQRIDPFTRVFDSP